MLDHDLKKKIANTITKYEAKCDQMQMQISSLKNVIHQLIITPISDHYEINDHLAQFRKHIDDDFDPEILEDKVNFLSMLLNKLHKKKTDSFQEVNALIKQCTDSITLLASKTQDKRAISKLKKLVETNAENQTILLNFNTVLSQCVNSTIQELEALQLSKKNALLGIPSEINVKVNDSLQQLLNHLSIPKDLDSKKDKIKTVLDQQMHDEDLTKIIDGLTELVVDAFNVEQSRFKGFLQQLTTQLKDVDVYLEVTTQSNKDSSNESLQLEHNIQENIAQIKTHLDSSTTIEELTGKVSQNLEGIGSRIKQYRENEKKREQELEAKIKSLKSKLAESEQSADEIKNILTSQKYKINHDSLTGLPNRESYDEHMLDSFMRWKRNAKDLSIAICDIDHFKQVNDSFGHLAGDKVLKKVAELLKGSIRSSDFIARVGGEEFVLIFEQTPSHTAVAIVEKLRELVQQCQFYYRDNKVDITVCFGVTTIKRDDDIESFFIRADNAMYAAKHAGRNRVEVC